MVFDFGLVDEVLDVNRSPDYLLESQDMLLPVHSQLGTESWGVVMAHTPSV